MRAEADRDRAQSKGPETDGLWGASESPLFGLPFGIILVVLLLAASGYTFLTVAMSL